MGKDKIENTIKWKYKKFSIHNTYAEAEIITHQLTLMKSRNGYGGQDGP